MNLFNLQLEILSEDSIWKTPSDIIQSPLRSPRTELSTPTYNRFSMCPRTSGPVIVGKQLGKGSFGKVEVVSIQDEHAELGELGTLIEPFVDDHVSRHPMGSMDLALPRPGGGSKLLGGGDVRSFGF